MLSAEEHIKANLIKEGLELEKYNRKKAILFYENLLSNELFSNDYYLYRRLTILFEKINDFRSQYEIIKSFFYSNIYCHDCVLLFFKNKLMNLIRRKFTTKSEIDALLEYFKENGYNNKDKSNFPVVIGDRIHTKNGEPKKISEKKYISDQVYYGRIKRAYGYRYEGEYQKAINAFEELIYVKKYPSYKYYNQLVYIYRELDDYDNALRVVNEYYNSKCYKNKRSEWIFKRHLEEIGQLKKYGKIMPKSELVIVYPSEWNKDNGPIISNDGYLEENYDSDSIYYDNYEYHGKLKMKYQVDINEPLIFYEFDENLSKEDNIQRKYYLKRYAYELYDKKRFNDYILLLQKLKGNSYFKNDWHLYRRLNIIYNEKDMYEENFENIKELFYQNIWLNDYNYIYFIRSLKNIFKNISIEENNIDKWFDYYEMHGALNKNKSNDPIALADKFKFENNELMVLADKRFGEDQTILFMKDQAKFFEDSGDYLKALSNYLQLIHGGLKDSGCYKKAAEIFEILDKYDSLFELLKKYYNNDFDINVDKKWVLKKLEIINYYLDTDYTLNDL